MARVWTRSEGPGQLGGVRRRPPDPRLSEHSRLWCGGASFFSASPDKVAYVRPVAESGDTEGLWGLSQLGRGGPNPGVSDQTGQPAAVNQRPKMGWISWGWGAQFEFGRTARFHYKEEIQSPAIHLRGLCSTRCVLVLLQLHLPPGQTAPLTQEAHASCSWGPYTRGLRGAES